MKIFNILLLFIITNAFSQQLKDQGVTQNIFAGKLSRVLFVYDDAQSKEAVGSPYVENFRLAKIVDYNKLYLIRYDAVNDEMQAKNDKDEIIIIDKNTIKKVTFTNNGSIYKLFDYTYKEELKRGYLKIIYEDQKISLLKKEITKFFPEKKAASSYQNDIPPIYKKMTGIHFISNKKTGFLNSFDKKKDFLKLFSKEKNDLEKFIKKEKVNFKKEKDLIRLIKYLNSLV
jgi:hypothetical protein